MANRAGRTLCFAGVLRDRSAPSRDVLNYKSLVPERLPRQTPVVLARFTPQSEHLKAVGEGPRALGPGGERLPGRCIHEAFSEVAPPPLAACKRCAPPPGAPADGRVGWRSVLLRGASCSAPQPGKAAPSVGEGE